MAFLPVIWLPGKRTTLSLKVSFCSFISLDDTYIVIVTGTLGPVQVITIVGNEPISGQVSGYSKGMSWLTHSNSHRSLRGLRPN